ncbi:protein-export membrane protein SecD [Candidatus Daviesbacteria bacterium RIFOXYD1_FULL_41_10]|uniref:Protein translocase subunit SecD n=2 Tax=Candidatus Daviesiibacteriota TaxID=1752718 RepID=A0A1F5MYZ2_9BACT|nr:MAG: Preprotein translocase subunit SecD [Candidatus Daviesbacteria bacterium GW2011_GWB1_41_5]OGE70584.1 MAG: protein-export membrane protein SecD [Candidatus Daviesbacteria bacterium RIFOXYD1_FULL_41_10]
MTSRWTLWLIILVTIFSLWINLPLIPQIPTPLTNFIGKFPVKLGLDLLGGTELVMRAKMDKIAPEDQDSALVAAREVIERRVNLYGVSEAVVQTSRLGNERRILVELPGIKDTAAAVNLVGKTAQLEFREIPATSSAESSSSGHPLQIFSQSTGLTGADLKKAAVTFGSSGKSSGPQVSIEFTSDGAKKFAEITKRNVGKPLAIFLDNQLVSAPNVEQEIIGSAVITGQFTSEEAKELSIQLNAGALPVPIELLSQRTIGATLGHESVQKSLVAGGIGILLVMLFMIFYYGVYGLVADMALILYTVFVLSIFRTGLFILPPVTLTLAGIAGFILSVGMAVDANILIFERMKEEARLGKSGTLALEHGFSRAWTSIRDSNVSSLITASILYAFGTSVVRGFALTLAIGVMVSMFSAIFVTRTFLRLLLASIWRSGPRFKK